MLVYQRVPSGHQTWLAGKSPFWMEVKKLRKSSRNVELSSLPCLTTRGFVSVYDKSASCKTLASETSLTEFLLWPVQKKTRNWHHCQQKCQFQTPITRVFQAITNNKAALYRASNLCTERGSCFGYLWTSNGSKVVFKSAYETWKITTCAFWDKLQTCMWSYVDTCVYIYIYIIYIYMWLYMHLYIHTITESGQLNWPTPPHTAAARTPGRPAGWTWYIAQ